MSKQSKLIVFPCPYDRPCNNYQCRNITKNSMWFIGRPENLSNCTIYCEDCIRHMVDNLPEQFAPKDETMIEKAKAEALNEVNALIAEKDSKIEALEQELLLSKSITQSDENGTPEPKNEEPEPASEHQEQSALKNTDPVSDGEQKDGDEEELENTTEVFRCLDCGREDFKSQRALDSHRGKAHKE